MLFGYFTLFVALVISTVAEFYSIVGLTSIFAAAFWPVVIMGAALGVGKVTAAVWLKLNWERAKWTYKLYLVPAVVFLMFLTSMGIFGFLSKAHSDQSLVSGDVQSKIAVYDEKIKIEKDNIDANRKALKQMDEAVDQVMGRSSDEKGAEKAVAIRRAQQKERGRITQDIAEAQKKIIALNEERAPIAAEVRKVEAEVGPIKYIAAMIYGDNPDGNLLEAAVRWVIILIVAVFDPLALMLILAAQQSLRWAKQEREEKLVEEPENNAEATIVEEDPVETPEEQVKEPAQEEPVADGLAYLNTPFVHFQNLQPMVYKYEVVETTTPAYPADDGPLTEEQVEQIQETASEDLPEGETTTVDQLFPEEPVVEEPVAEPLVVEEPVAETTSTFMDLRGKPAPPPPPETLPPPVKEVIVIPEAMDPKKGITVDTGLTADNDMSGAKEVKAHFGIAFPDSPEKGELYLRVDYLPSRLFKFNGSKWIEVDKAMTDSYVYDSEYIKFLISEIEAGHVDPDDLSQSERDQITNYLSSNEQSRNPT